MSKSRKKKNLPATARSVEMLPGPEVPGKKKYQIWALIIWIIGILFIFLKWGQF